MQLLTHLGTYATKHYSYVEHGYYSLNDVPRKL